MAYRDVVMVITKDGWAEVRSKGDHHQFRKPGNPNVVTVPDHGPHDLSKGVVSSIRRKTGLSLR